MKKQYIAPKTLTVNILHTHILAGSPGITTSETSALQGGEVLGRESSFSAWDEEE
jgi:hypothetical protein